MNIRTRLAAIALASAGLIAACGGGGGSAGTPGGGTGTLKLALTDAPACGFENVWVTVERVRVHSDATGWVDLNLPQPVRADLLTLTNGALLPLGTLELPAGTYTQMRMVLGSDTVIKPVGEPEVTLKTPSGQQSGVKLNLGIEVEPGKVAEVGIDFSACRSFHRAGHSGKYMMKPVLTAIPYVSDAGYKVVGWVDPALASADTTVSLQQGGEVARATPPKMTVDERGQFVLAPVDPGTYDLVITAPGRATAVMTGVTVSTAETTLIGSSIVRFDPPLSATSFTFSGTVTVNGDPANTGGSVRALQALTGGATVEAGWAAADAVTGFYALALPTAAPVLSTPYAPGLTSITFSVAGVPGLYTLEAEVPGAVPISKPDQLLDADKTVDFAFTL